MPDDLYRPAVGILLLNPHGKAFVGQRIDTSDAWQLPQGGIDAGEDPEARRVPRAPRGNGGRTGGSSREVTRLAPLRPPGCAGRQLVEGALPGTAAEVVRDAAHGSRIGIDIGPGGEFSAWRWVPPCRLPHLIVPFKRAMYVELLAEFAAFLDRPAGN